MATENSAHVSPTASLAEHVSAQSSSSVPQKRTLDLANARRRPVKVTRACDVCKAKKAKCSGELPCDSCNRRGLHCQYKAVYSRGKAPTPKLAEPPSHQQLDNGGASTPQHRPPTDPVYPHPILNVPSNRHSQFASLNMNDIIPMNRPGETEPPSRASPGLEVAGQYTDPTSGLSFLRRAWWRISNSNENTQVEKDQLASTGDNQRLMSAGDKPFKETGPVQMPSLGRCNELMALYFDFCIATYRLLHRPTVKLWLASVCENARCGRALSDGIGRAKAAVVLSVLAVASFHEEKARGDVAFSPVNEVTTQSQSDEFFLGATRLTETETGIPQLESAQSRIIQVLYLLMSCRFNQAWYTFGHTLQIISALGLHRRYDRKRPSNTQRRDYIDEQCRKRTFWVAYILDKYLGVIFGRPRHYHDEDIDQDFPDAVNDEDMTSAGPHETSSDDCHVESLVCHARLAQLAERISREVYSIKPVPDHVRLAASHRLGAELRQWRASLPPLLGAINPNSLILTFRRQSTVLKLSYCHAVMLAHRPFLLKSTTRNNDEMRSLAKESSTECIAAARTVLEAVDRMAHEGRLFHSFWWTHYICFCALVVVYVWAIQESGNHTTLDERRKVLDHAERCLQHLEQATTSNSPSRKYSIILQELRAEAKRKTARSVHAPIATTTTNSNADDPTIHGMPSTGLLHADAVSQMWQPMFSSPIDDTTPPGLVNFWEDWQTTDWLDLDSSAFVPCPDSELASVALMNNIS